MYASILVLFVCHVEADLTIILSFFYLPFLGGAQCLCVRVRWVCISTGPLELWDWSSGHPGRCVSLRCIG